MTFKYRFHLRIFFGLILFLIANQSAYSSTFIGSGQTVSTSTVANQDTVVFTGSSGTLNYNQALDRTVSNGNKDLSSITTNTNGVGIININSFNSLEITGNIGSATQKIDQITFSGTGTLIINGSLYTNNALGVDASVGGGINLTGDDATIDSVIGTSGAKLVTLEIAGSNINFLGNLFVDTVSIASNKSATLSSSSIINSDLGNVTLFDNSSLTLNSSADISGLSTTTLSTIEIAANKQLNGSGNLIINGTLNLALSTSNSSTPMIAGNNITIANTNGININFDYNDATFLKTGSSNAQNFLTATTALTTGLNNVTITDTSVLLSPTITVSSNTKSLVVTQNIDTTTTNKLNDGDLAAANFLIDNATATDINSARTALFKITSQSSLEESLGTLQVDKSNMIQKTSMDIALAIENVVDYRLQSLNYQQSQIANEKANKKKADDARPILEKNIIPKNSGIWGQVFGATATMDDIENKKASSTNLDAKGYDANFGGVIFGWDRIFRDENVNSIWGATVSYSKGSADSNSLSKQSTDINAYNLTLYNHNISKDGLGFYNQNSFGFGYNQYDSERTIDLDTYQSEAKANFNGMQYLAKTSFGYNFKMSQKSIFSTFTGIKYSGLKLDDYSEKNDGGLGLKVKNDNFGLATSELGFRIIGSLGSVIEPQINVTWLHNLSTSGAKSSSTFINGNTNQNSIKNTGVDLDANILNAGAQINFKTTQNTGLALRYDLQKSSNFTSHLGSVKFAWTF
jgi:outer membrane autotransporter protein